MSANTTYDHGTFISPLTWRYGSEEMHHVFSEVHKRQLLRRVWIALARAEMKAGIVTKEQVEELEEHKDDVDIARALEIESDIHHDLMAEIRTYAEQCPKAGGIIHLGATSMDALDNADALRFKEALSIIEDKLTTLLDELSEKAERYKSVPTMAFTHIQPAEITTIGYRLSQTILDLTDDLEGHGGGDHRMIDKLYEILAEGNTEVDTSIENSVESHYMAIAAEASRLEGGKLVELAPYRKD